MSSIPTLTTPLSPPYTPNPSAPEPPSTASLIASLALTPNIEGGYFAEIDRNPLTIPTPFPSSSSSDKKTAEKPFSGDESRRNASTSIFYLLTRNNPQGHFHRNAGRTVHTVIEGRGRYVLIHDDEEGVDTGGTGGESVRKTKRVETFVVGKDVSAGEKAVWIVEGGKYKGSFLLEGEERLLISETVIPGFEYSDHDFLTLEKFKTLVTEKQAAELEWLVRKT